MNEEKEQEQLDIQLLGDHILIDLESETTQRRGQVWTVSMTDDESIHYGTVSYVGPGIYDAEGELIPVRVSVGDVVLFANDYLKIEYNKRKLLAMRENNIIGIVR